MIISVASGKGGTGKTLIATSLALTIKDNCKVQLLDCDVEEPNAHIFIKSEIKNKEPVYLSVPRVDEDKCTYCGLCSEVCAYNAIIVIKKHILVFDNLCHGCGACTYLCPEKAITEKNRETGVTNTGSSGNLDFIQGILTLGEAMSTPVISAVKHKVDSEKVVIIDSPPGTSCPVINSVIGSDFCLLVTEPTPFGLNDLTLAVETVQKLDITCGVIINRSGKDDLEVEEYCRETSIPVMMKIPLDVRIAEMYSNGITLVEGEPAWKQEFRALYENILEITSERNNGVKR